MASRRRKAGKKSLGTVKSKYPVSPRQHAQLRQAVIAQSAGKLAAAEAEYRDLLAKNCRTVEIYCNLARICAQTARREEADELWKKALTIDPRSLEAKMNLADSRVQSGDVVRALELYQQITADHADFHIARYMLANILKSQGKMDEAADQYRQVMAQQPGYTQAHFSYSGIHKYEDESDPHIGAMLELYGRRDLQQDNRIHLAFALAKAFEDIGDFANAFRFLESGNDLRFSQFTYDIESDRELIQSIIRAFTDVAISRHQVKTYSSNRPIFVVGMPRSGTTLVEKIIASHSDVFGAGELEYMFALGTSFFLGPSNNFQFQSLDSYAQGNFEKAGKLYLEKINSLNSQARHVTDKMPFNMMMIGLIKIALPDARIIHCVRDARDTCLSIYKQNFTTGNYRFAYDLKTVAQFHNVYKALMQHWHEVMPGAIYDVRYETLTENPDREIRQLLSHCDLEFQPRCLEFDKTEAVVKTASAFQVRQPMYTSSVGMWKKYSEFLSPMLDELEADQDGESVLHQN